MAAIRAAKQLRISRGHAWGFPSGRWFPRWSCPADTGGRLAAHLFVTLQGASSLAPPQPRLQRLSFAERGKNPNVRAAWFNEISRHSVRNMTLRASILLVLVLFGNALGAVAQPGKADDKAAVYFPGADWEHRLPAEAGVNPALLQEAIDFAVANETKAPRDLVMNPYQTFGREPFGYAIGPIRE